MERQRQKQIAKNACVQACRLKDILKDPFQLWLWPHPAQHMLQEPNAPLQSTDRHPVHHPNPEWGGARWQAAQLKVTKLFPFPWRRLKAALTSLTGCPEQRAHCFSGQFSSSKSMCVNVRNSLWLSSECQSLVIFFSQNWNQWSDGLKKKSTPFEIPSFHRKPDACHSLGPSIPLHIWQLGWTWTTWEGADCHVLGLHFPWCCRRSTNHCIEPLVVLIVINLELTWWSVKAAWPSATLH